MEADGEAVEAREVVDTVLEAGEAMEAMEHMAWTTAAMEVMTVRRKLHFLS